MEIYLSSETEERADSLLLPIRNIVDSLLDDIRKNEYGSALTSVGVFAIIMKEEMYDSGGYCERQYYSKVRKEADIRLRLNYKSFCNVRTQVLDTVRTVYSIDIEKDSNDVITIRVRGNGFLYNMVRILAGTLMAVGMGQRKPEEMPDILAACDRAAAGPTAPAKGLMLVGMEYQD